MAPVLIIIGLLMVITGGRGTYSQFGTQIASDVQGYAPQGIAIAAVGAVGYIPAVQTISRWLLAFIIIVIFLAQNKSTAGFFQQFQSALSQGPKQPQAVAQQSNTSSATNPSGGPTIDLGPFGSINENPIVPGGLTDRLIQGFENFFSGPSTPTSGATP